MTGSDWMLLDAEHAPNDVLALIAQRRLALRKRAQSCGTHHAPL